MSGKLTRWASASVAMVCVAALLAGCSTARGDHATASTSKTVITGDITIAAAASLHDAFDEAIARFDSAHPGVHVTATFDGSSTLATQILGGASVDVFASADQANMAKVTDEKLATRPVIFAKNTLVIAVPAGNPGHVRRLSDLADPALKVVLCAPAVPCGAAATTLLANAGVTVHPVSLEQNVTAVLTKVSDDEADAGLVYTTDAATTKKVTAIVPAGADSVVNSYPIAVLKASKNQATAQAFSDFITGKQGQKILSSFGFASP